MEHFATLKSKYQATQYADSSPSSLLYFILRKADSEIEITEIERNWVREHKLLETLEAIRKEHRYREKELRKLESEFSHLKSKYKATNYDVSWKSSPLYFATQYEDSSPSSHLYKVLKKLDSENYLGEQDINFLRKRKLTETITIAQDKYAASLKSKIESGEQLEESQINWLKENGREEVITFAKEKHFALLKIKYRILDPWNKLPLDPFYTIMQQLEREERLDPVLVVQLIEKELLSPEGRIALAFYRLEALFFEQEYQRTGNQWNLPNASSYWRKADRPKQALKLTENLNLEKIKENKLKSAILTTRGGAFRDIDELDKAEKCARQGIEYQPNSHHPYTLMGAICFERGEYSQGEYWFVEAIKRGASPRDQDAEIKRVVKNAKDENKRREVVDYLLKKDPQRYAWAKSYLKKSQNKGK